MTKQIEEQFKEAFSMKSLVNALEDYQKDKITEYDLNKSVSSFLAESSSDEYKNRIAMLKNSIQESGKITNLVLFDPVKFQKICKDS